MIRMRHLRSTLPQFNPATDDAAFAGWQHAADIIITRMKEYQIQLAAFIFTDHAPGAAHPGWRLVMFHHQNFKSGDAAIDYVGKRRAVPPVNHSHGQVAQYINDMCANAFFKRCRQLGPDAWQYRRRCKKPKNFGGTTWMHRVSCLPSNGLICSPDLTTKRMAKQKPVGVAGCLYI